MSSRIPGYMMRQSVSVTPYLGSGAYDDVYGDAYNLRCRIEPRNELVRTRQGEETVAAAKMYTTPEAPIRVLDKVVWENVPYDVINVMSEPGANGRIHHKECWLR